MATFKAVVFTTKNHIKADGTTNIKIRLYHNKESQYIPTPYYIEPEYFSNGTVTTFYHDNVLLNYQIGELLQVHKRNYIELGTARASRMLCSELRDYLVSISETSVEFIDFIDFAKDFIKKTKKEKTKSWYNSGISVLCWHLGKNVEKDKLNVRDITTSCIKSLIEKLSTSGVNGDPLEPGTISCYLRSIRAIFNKCKNHYNDEDFDIIPIPHDPFKKVIIPKYRRKRKNVDIETIKIIRDCNPKTKREEIARDVFMMLFYLMGINVVDFYHLDKTNYNRVEWERSKTDKDDADHIIPLSVKVEPELKTLLDKYTNKTLLSELRKRYKKYDYLTKAVNKGLAQICENLNIPKVTTNWARHSWASIARNKARIPKADVDFCLGHVNNDYKMADIYIDIDYGICDDANRKVLDLLK